MEHVLGFVRDVHIDDLDGYTGENVHYILKLLEHKYNTSYTDDDRNKRHVTQIIPEVLNLPMVTQSIVQDGEHGDITEDYLSSLLGRYTRVALDDLGLDETSTPNPSAEDIYNDYMQQLLSENQRLRHDIDKLEKSLSVMYKSEDSLKRHKRNTQNSTVSNVYNETSTGKNNVLMQDNSSSLLSSASTEINTRAPNDSYHSKNGYEKYKYYQSYTKSKKLLKIAHTLHYCSIGILGLFVIQVMFVY